MGRSEELFERAVKRIPGGVNSPVRAYGAIGMAPRFIKRADGCHIYDVDDNCYVDYIDSWGPMILGHNFPEIREAVVKACAEGLSLDVLQRLKWKWQNLSVSIFHMWKWYVW